MQTLAVNGYSADVVRDVLHGSPRHVAFTYELLESDNSHKAWATNLVASCKIKNNSLADIKRTADMNILDDGSIDWLSDRFRPWFRLRMPDGGWAEWPLGIYLPATPKRSGPSVTRPVQLYDQNLILHDDKVTDRYTVAAGTNVITAALAVLAAAGITQVNYAATAETLPVDRDWGPGTTRYRIVQDLLNMIGYRTIYFNSVGYAVLEKYQRPDDRAVNYEYVTDDESVTTPRFTHELDLFKIPNKWVLVVGEPDRAVLTSTYTNTEPTSPTSTVSRGRTIVDFRGNVEATSQDALDDLAERIAFDASQVYETISIETASMPMHEDADMIGIEHSGWGESGNFVEQTWDLELRAGALMKHTARRVVTV